ncbi:hypothetical protein SOCEGT47_048780 [Sorangium cellulosum]|jgi:hypothetical protein|uniref:STAS domain-containing protein n=1 Tax=Sorangium cellulosum TaxID=56 RepID=A0A4P2Q559_SORCE|nr:hypothetical protein [Sorangium cellulosum]AUX24341.1 hypothetical protein SOCEGT47_048780 [Sorangium cellulosum]
MSSFKVEPVVTDSFGIEAALRDDRLVVKLTGTGDMAAAGPLGAYLKTLQGEVIGRSLRAIELDVKALYFLNSSCLKAFVSFIGGLASQGVKSKIRFITDARLGWQRRSLTALERMSPELVSIEDV